MDDLSDFLDRMARTAVDTRVSTFAKALADAHPGCLAVLAYGSALRDSSPAETLIDYYLLFDAPHHLNKSRLLCWLGERLPPNVHYAEHDSGGLTLRSKYAVMTLERFTAWVSHQTSNPYLWARFAQPSRIVWLRDESVRPRLLAALGEAARTAYGHAVFLSPAAPWETLFRNTYRTELRPESAGRAAQIIEADRDHYAGLAKLLQGTPPVAASWGMKRAMGKLWSIARLAKAAFTFQGGADYAAWKIARHSGVRIEVSDWQRRHPFLAGLMLLPRLLGKRGLR